MARPKRDHEPITVTTLPPITRHSYVPATSEEITRRRALFKEAMHLREEIGPIGVSTAELIREDRDELVVGEAEGNG
ncbi:MAG: hypothetical protein EXR50_01350 [Dehalococcoidia bacterium]|nr:hypothetical protein [Dehalococcoidia bacterium]